MSNYVPLVVSHINVKNKYSIILKQLPYKKYKSLKTKQNVEAAAEDQSWDKGVRENLQSPMHLNYQLFWLEWDRKSDIVHSSRQMLSKSLVWDSKAESKISQVRKAGGGVRKPRNLTNHSQNQRFCWETDSQLHPILACHVRPLLIILQDFLTH